MVIAPVLDEDAGGGRPRPVGQPADARRRRHAEGAPPAGADGARDAVQPGPPAQHDRRHRDGRRSSSRRCRRSITGRERSTSWSTTPSSACWRCSASTARDAQGLERACRAHGAAAVSGGLVCPSALARARTRRSDTPAGRGCRCSGRAPGTGRRARVEVVAQDHAAEAQVGLHVEQPAGSPSPISARPERHHLHVAARAGDADRVLAKAAFDLDQAEHQRRVEAGAPALVPERLAGTRRASACSALLLLQALAHRAEPAQVGQARRRSCRTSGFGGALSRDRQPPARSAPNRRAAPRPARRPAHAATRADGDAAPQRAAAAIATPAAPPVGQGAGMLMRASLPFTKRERVGQRHLAGGARRAGPGTRPCLPSGRGREMTTRCGTPISSQSANIAPGRSPRSSSSTSTPAPASSSCSASAAALHVGAAVVADRADHHGERRDRVGPDDAALVVVLLDRRAEDARDADAVAAHLAAAAACRPRRGRWRSWPCCTWCRAEHVADLDAALDRQHALAVGRRVARDDVADVGHDVGLGQVAAPVDAGDVEVDLVGAADEVGSCAATVRSATTFTGLLQCRSARGSRACSRSAPRSRRRSRSGSRRSGPAPCRP